MRRWSLRTQLLSFGIAATALPILALLWVVVATSSSDEIIDGPDGQFVSEQSSSGDVPAVVFFVAFALVAAAAVAVWCWSGRAVKPMREITQLADHIQVGSLDRRIGLDGEAEEVQQLGQSFDRMLDRLERASRSQRQLIEDASHELRTPLAALAINNEVIRNNAKPTEADYEAGLDRSEALVARMQLTLDELLQGARARTQQTGQVDNDLATIVHRVAEQQRVARPGIVIAVDGPGQLLLPIDGPSIERLLTNLIDNAARFSPSDTPVEIHFATEPPTLSVTDHGPGIAPEDLAHVFDRYYRADEGPGHGIGLALVKQVADAHGTIEVQSPVPDQHTGTRFVLRFHRATSG